MKAFMILGANNSFMTEVDEPVLENDYSVKVAVESVGICGTDIKIFEGHHSQSKNQRRIPGHEFAGVVTEVGKSVSKLKVGDRVVHEPISYCGECYACRHGEENVCENLKVTGCNMSGGLEEYFVADERQWHKLPDWITWNEAAVIEPYTIVAHACERAEIHPDDVVLIYGAGPIGLALADTARAMGAQIVISEVCDARLDIAKKMGLEHVVDAKCCDVNEYVMELTGGKGPNVVSDCAGLPDSCEKAIEILSPAGRFVPLAPVTFTLDAYWATRKQVRIITTRLQKDKFIPVISKFKMYKEAVDLMVTDEFDFMDSKAAFERACSTNARTGKVIIRFHRFQDAKQEN